VFGLVITLMGCYHGYHSKGGAQGVGQATTNAVVSAYILILTSNYILFHLKSEKAWPSNLVPSTDFDRWLAERNHPVYLLARESNRPKLEALAAERKATLQQLTPLYLGVLLPSR